MDRRIVRTRATLQQAVMDLVEEQDLSRITIADVAERAGVSRSTFYDHYRDVHELAEAACTAMVDGLIAALPPAETGAAGPGGRSAEHAAAEALAGFFASFAEHANLFRSLVGPQGSARILDRIRRHTIDAVYRTKNPDLPDCPTGEFGSPHDVAAAFAAGALVGVAIDWLQRDCPVSAKNLADQTLPLFMAMAKAS